MSGRHKHRARRLSPWAPALLMSTLLCSACGPNHIGPYSPRERQFEPTDYAAHEAQRTAGSLWSEASPSLFEDMRARRVGDVVVVAIDEQTSARGDARTTLDREAEVSAQVTGLFGLLGAIQRAYPDLDPSALLGLASESEFAGQGRTERSGTLTGTIAVYVRRVLPNGDLYVEGSKVVLVNNEELHLYISGVIRPEDVMQDNTVASSRLADAQVEFTGRGDLTDHQRPGWLHRAINAVTPF